MARDFERGSSETVTFADPNIGVQGAQTWAGWVKLETGTDNAILSYGDFTNGRGFTWGINGSGKSRIRFNVSAGSVDQADSSSVLSTGTWYHLAWTRNQASFSTVSFYLNGGADGTSSNDDPAGLQNSGDDIVLGNKAAGDSSGMGYYDGVLHDVMFYDAALSASEIKGLYNGQWRDIRRSNLKFYAPLWGTHSSEINLTSLAVTGTVSGTTVVGGGPSVNIFPNIWWGSSNIEAGAGGGVTDSYSGRGVGRGIMRGIG